MPAPATADEFLDLVQKSGVADGARIKSHLTLISERSGIPTDPSKLAGILVRDGLLTYFQADQLLQGKWKRFFIGKYKVLERIGVGGMGHVFLCEHKLMRRRVAVKVLPAAKAVDPSSLERFYREARAAAALDHPNIVHAYDVDQDENLHFLVMEYVDGTNLQDLVKKFGPLDITRACHYIYAAAIGLQHAFELGLVHRDIKPGNILVDRNGVVKVLDMGLARFFNDDEDALTKKYDENILGTADYLAPEQAIDSHTVDIRADIYGLGGTFFYLLTGQPPFPEGTVAQKLLWHQTREPAALRTLRTEVPVELTAVVTKMMAKNMAERFQTPAEVLAVLADWVQIPIAPPTEKEMPQLSPAATGSLIGQPLARGFSGPPTVVSGPTTIATTAASEASPTVPLPNGDAPVPTAARPAIPNRTPATGIMPAASAPVAPRLAKPGIEPPAPAGVWEQLASDTSPGTTTDTERTRRAPSQSRTDCPQRRRRLPLFVIVGSLVALLVLLGVAAASYIWFSKMSNSPPIPISEGPRTWYVSTHGSPDPTHTLTSLAAALDRAGSNDVIQILEDQIEDTIPVRISSLTGVRKGIRVKAASPSKTVTWTPKSPGRKQGMLEIADVEDLTITGLTLKLEGRVDFGVIVSRSCKGLTLEGITVDSPASVGFQLLAAAGDADRPIRIRDCRVLARASIQSAVELADGTRNVVAENCRLEGPGSTAIKVNGTVQAELRNNRVFNFDRGIHLTADPAKPPAIDLTVANNTFHSIKTAVLEINRPAASLKRLSLTNNLFLKSGAIGTAPVKIVAGYEAKGNARDKATKDGNLPADATVIDFEYPTPNPKSDAQFLRTPAGKLPNIGAK